MMNADTLAGEIYDAINTQLADAFGDDYKPGSAEKGLRALCSGIAEAVVLHIQTNARTATSGEGIE